MGDEREAAKRGSCGPVAGGYSICLDEDRIRSFMEAADFSSASELDHFAALGAQLDARVRERGGASFLALSIGGKALERDFAVLEVAHVLAKNGRSVLVADCDFLNPGLSGLVENLEDHGFLDLLLYGSSLKSVAKTIGIDGVSVAGPGSFPVSRTIPFALKEFDKIRDFLRSKHDVVIYCTTLHTEDERVNPLVSLVDGVVVACRIDDLAEGELERHLASLGGERAPSVELVCFCGRPEEAPAAAPAPPASEAGREAPHIEYIHEPAAEGARAKPAAAPAAEATPEIETRRGRRRVSALRVVLVSTAVVVAIFAVWWGAVNRAVKDSGSRVERPSVATERSGGDTSGIPGIGVAPVESAAAEDGRDTASTAEQAVASQPEPSRVSAGPAAAGAAAEPARAAAAKYAIHVASFTDPVRAETERKFLEKSGFAARVVEVTIRGERWLRVFAGAYATMEEAERERLEILALKGHAYARIVEIAKTGI